MNEIDKLRKIYISCPQSDNLKKWDQLEGKLDNQHSPYTSLPSYLIAVILTTLLFSTAAVGAAQAAKPGDQLYTLKIFTDNTIAAITRNPELKVQKRAEDVIKVSTNSGQLEKAVQRYQQTVEDVKRETQKPQDQQKLQQTLKNQDQKFTEAARENPGLSRKLPEIIQVDQKIEKEIKGVKTENQPQNKGQENKENKENEKNGANRGKSKNK